MFACLRTYGIALGLGCLLIVGATPKTTHATADSLLTTQQTRFLGLHMSDAAARLPPPADRWWARDKARHMAFSFLWTLSTQYALVNKAGWSEADALPTSVGVTVTVGLSKELYDWRAGPTRHFSGKDLVANGVGILAAVGVILL